MGQKFAHPGAALPVLLERFDRREQQALARLRGHGAEPFPRQGSFGDRLAVQFLELGLVVVELDMSRPAILKEVNDLLGLGRQMRRTQHSAGTLTDRAGPCSSVRRPTVAAQQPAQCGGTETAGGAAKELASRQMLSMFNGWVHSVTPWSGLRPNSKSPGKLRCKPRAPTHRGPDSAAIHRRRGISSKRLGHGQIPPSAG